MSAAIAAGRTSSFSRTATPNEVNAPIPALLATAAVHHHLIREKTRTRVGLVVETGEALEMHHFCLLIGYGAGADQPVPRVRHHRDLVREANGRRNE